MPKSGPIIREKPVNPRKKQQAKLLLFTFVGILVLAAVPLYFLLPKEDTFKLTDYTYAEVKSRTFRQIVPVVGQILPEKQITINAPFKGEITNIYVEPGDEIEKDTLLLELESEELTQSLKNSEEELTKALNDLIKTEVELEIESYRHEKTLADIEKSFLELKIAYEEKEELYVLGEISLKALEDAKEALENAEIDNKIKELTASKSLITAQTALTQAKKQHALAEKKLSDLKELEKQKIVLSPIDGKVLDIAFKTGSTVGANVVLIKMATVQNPYIDVMIPVAESENIFSNMPAVIKISSKDYLGYVEKVSLDVKYNQQLGSYVSGVIRFQQDPGFILPYTECKVEIETGVRENVLYLPRGPYISTGQSMFVYRIDQDKAIKTDVILGSFDGADIEVVKGLSLGDKVITSSYDRFAEYKEIDISIEGGRKQ